MDFSELTMKSVPLLSGILMMTHAMASAENIPLPPEAGGGAYSTYLDNDVFGGEDRDYTNGVRFSWISDPLDLSDLGNLAKLAEILGKPGFGNSREVSYHYGFSLTQLIFTPEDYRTSAQPEDQRRYAGWLGLGFSLHAQDEHVLNSLEFTLGTTGADSFAENTQDTIHGMGDIEKFNGWDEQIPNEITADVSFIQKRRMNLDSMEHGDFSMDHTIEWGARLGTFRTSSHIGTSLRGGFHLSPDFSDLRLSETAYSHQHVRTADFKPTARSTYYIAGAVIRGIAHDATLDGPLFSGFEAGNEREAFVAEVFFGIGMSCHRIELSYVHTWRTAEYEEQEGISEFGSIGIHIHF